MEIKAVYYLWPRHLPNWIISSNGSIENIQYSGQCMHQPDVSWKQSEWEGLQWHPTPVLLPGKSHGQRSLVGCSPWGRWESDTTEWLHFHFSLSCIREGNGNPLQCSCLENPRDGGAWWAAGYGVTQSRTRLKRLSSSSSIQIDELERIVFTNVLRLRDEVTD